MDAGPMYSHPFHPCDHTRRRDWKGKARPYTRTERPVRYYIIDYGLSHRLRPDEQPLILPIVGADKSVPEHQGMREAELSDPFATDIYTAGSLVNAWFIRVCRWGPFVLKSHSSASAYSGLEVDTTLYSLSCQT